MKVKFANDVVRECSAPTEQKVFKLGVGVGWILILRLNGGITSTDLDELMTDDNVKTLEFLSVKENGEESTLFTLDGYEKVTSSTIRHADDIASTYAEIQLTKGL